MKKNILKYNKTMKYRNMRTEREKIQQNVTCTTCTHTKNICQRYPTRIQAQTKREKVGQI